MAKKISWLFLIFAFAVIVHRYYDFLYAKQFMFSVEQPCDSQAGVCARRDCSVIDSCPPNDLSSFKTVEIRAQDYKFCTSNSCIVECAQGVIECKPVANE